jgi:pentatricopeptide repeat protein
LQENDWDGAKEMISAGMAYQHTLDLHSADGPHKRMEPNSKTPAVDSLQTMILLYCHDRIENLLQQGIASHPNSNKFLQVYNLSNKHRNYNNGERAAEFFGKMLEIGVIPTSESWALLIEAQALMATSVDNAAKDTIERLREMGVPLTIRMFNAVLNCHIRLQQNDEAERWWLKMHEEPDLDLNEESFLIILRLMEYKREAERAMWLIDEMRTTGIKPSLDTYNRLIRTCAFAPMWINGFEDTLDDVLKMIEGSELVPNEDTYNQLIFAYGEAGDARAAEFYFWEMSNKNIQPSTETYNQLLIAYGKAQSVGARSHGRKGRYARPPNKHWQRTPSQSEKDIMNIGGATATKLMSQGIHYAFDGDDKYNARGGKHSRGGKLIDALNEDWEVQEEFEHQLRFEAEEVVKVHGTVEDQLIREIEGYNEENNSNDKKTLLSTKGVNHNIPKFNVENDDQLESLLRGKGLGENARSMTELMTEMTDIDDMGEAHGENMDMIEFLNNSGLDSDAKAELEALLASVDDMDEKGLQSMLQSIESEEAETNLDNTTISSDGFSGNYHNENIDDIGTKQRNVWKDPFYKQRKKYIREQKRAQTTQGENANGSIFTFLNDPSREENIKKLSGSKSNDTSGLGNALAILDGFSDGDNKAVSPYRGENSGNEIDFGDYVDEQWDLIEFGTPQAANYLYEERYQVRVHQNCVRAKMAFDALSRNTTIVNDEEPVLLTHEEDNDHIVSLPNDDQIPVDGQLPKPNSQTLTALLSVYSESLNVEDTLRVFGGFRAYDLKPTQQAFSHMFRMFIRLGNIDAAMELKNDIQQFEDAGKRPMQPCSKSFGYLVNYFTSQDDIPQALKLLEEATSLGYKIPERHLRVLRGRCKGLGVRHPDLGSDPLHWAKNMKKMAKQKHSTQRRVEQVRSSSYSRE